MYHSDAVVCGKAAETGSESERKLGTTKLGAGGLACQGLPGANWATMGAPHLAAAATAASCALRVHFTFRGTSTIWPPAASIFCRALSLNADALTTSFLLSSPVPSTCCSSWVGAGREHEGGRGAMQGRNGGDASLTRKRLWQRRAEQRSLVSTA